MSLTTYMPTGKPYYSAIKPSETVSDFSLDLLQLTLPGYDIDTIETVLPFSATEWHNSLLKSWKVVQQHPSPGANTADQRKEAFWRTLITNRTSLSQPAKAEVEGYEFDVFWAFTTDPEAFVEADLLRFRNYNAAFFQHGFRRSFICTAGGRIGLAPAAVQFDDRVCLLAGAQTPFVLRRLGEQYLVIGECYVHDIMDGAHWSSLEAGDTEKTPIVLM